nr:ribosomal protein L16 [Stephanopyxis turris]
MLLRPKKIKYKKLQKGTLPKLNFRSNKLRFGSIGLKALTSGIISSKQIEASRQAINRKINRKGKIWIRIFPNIPVTKKPSEVRMGKGKGNVNHWVAKISAGTILFEICGVTNQKAILGFKTGSAKLPIKTTVIT